MFRNPNLTLQIQKIVRFELKDTKLIHDGLTLVFPQFSLKEILPNMLKPSNNISSLKIKKIKIESENIILQLCDDK
jgi:hypothetical protein